MKFVTSFAVFGLLAAAASAATGTSEGQAGLRRSESIVSSSALRRLGRRLARSTGTEEELALAKRGVSHGTFSGQATHYGASVSQGACGGWSSASDYVVALNIAQYGNAGSISPWCGKQVDITYGGQTVTATVVDCCPTCGFGALDMSTGLFTRFASLGQGVFQMSWTLAGGGGSSSKNNNNNNNNNKNDNSKSNSDSNNSNSKSNSNSNNSDNNNDNDSNSSRQSSSTTTSTLTSTSTVSPSTSSSSSSSSESVTVPTAGVPSATPATISSAGDPQNLALMNQAFANMVQMANFGRT